MKGIRFSALFVYSALFAGAEEEKGLPNTTRSYVEHLLGKEERSAVLEAEGLVLQALGGDGTEISKSTILPREEENETFTPDTPERSRCPFAGEIEETMAGTRALLEPDPDYGGGRETEHVFEEREEVWGLNELRPDEEKDNDCAESLVRLRAFSELEGGGTAGTRSGEAIENLRLFGGETLSCKRAPLGVALSDCCGNPAKGKNERGLLPDCSEEERKLFDARQNGRCVFLGKKSRTWGGSIRKYICFSSQFAKSIRNAAATQIGKDFGTYRHPDPEGLTVEELGKLHFERIDFKECESEIRAEIDPEKIKQMIRDSASEISSGKTTAKHMGVMENRQKQLTEEGRKR
ncbi:MAG: conjugal transfer protein TraN [Simkaniaceae bacterium]|nr:conjugal transfer protein TraN [Simkaniaceae bacterium]